MRMRTHLLSFVSVFALAATAAHAQLPATVGQSIPHGAAPPSGCGPSVSETGVEVVGLRVAWTGYTGNLVNMSVTGTDGPYFDVGVNGCNLDLLATTLAVCTSATAPDATTGCPIKTFYDQTGNGCDATQATGSAQGWLRLAQDGTHPVLYFNGGQQYTCTLPGAIGAVAWGVRANATNTPGVSYYLADIGNGTTAFSALQWYQVSGAVRFFDYDGSSFSIADPGLDETGSYATYVANAPDSSGANIIVNNTSGVPGTTQGTISSGTTFKIGAYTDGTFQGTMQFREAIVVDQIASCSTGSGDCYALYQNINGY